MFATTFTIYICPHKSQIRYAIAKELIQDLQVYICISDIEQLCSTMLCFHILSNFCYRFPSQLVPEDNNSLLRMSLQASLENAFISSPITESDAVKVGGSSSTHPELEGLKDEK